MNYRLHYYKLIDAAKARTSPLEYGETHHIVPKSEGGSNDKTNLVKLSFREHYIAHLLLAKIYDDFKMWTALQMMQTNPASADARSQTRMNSRLYKILRTKAIEKLSGKNNPMFGYKWSAEQRKKMSDATKGIHHWSAADRQRMKTQRKGLLYWNNGVENIRSRECPGEGWKRGKIVSALEC